MAVAANAGPARTVEVSADRSSNIAIKGRFAAWLCVLTIVAGVIFGLIYW
jgi:hypothetical protein